MRRPSRCTMPRFLLLLRAHRGSVPVIVSHHPPDLYSCLCSPHSASFHGMEFCFWLTCWSRDYVKVSQKLPGGKLPAGRLCAAQTDKSLAAYICQNCLDNKVQRKYSQTLRSLKNFSSGELSTETGKISWLVRAENIYEQSKMCRRVVNSAYKRAGIISLKTREFFCIFSGKQVADQF